MTMRVPFLDLGAQHAALRPQLQAAFDRIMDGCAFVGGPAVTRFEEDFAAFQGARFCIGVANGTDALALALRAVGIGPGDEVVTAANSFIASAEAVTLAGGRVVFADCDPVTQTMDVRDLARRIGPRTRAIVPVHLYGRPADMTAVMALANAHGLMVVEDCAQAHGATLDSAPVGRHGHAACFSFYPGKTLGACGDAGAVTTDDPALEQRIRMLANHGGLSKYRHDVEGTNSRLDGLQAAFLSVKLPHLRDWVAARRRVAARYSARLTPLGLAVPSDPANGTHAYHLYVVRVPQRERVMAALAEAGIGCGIHYPKALPNLPAYGYLGLTPGDYPVASEQEGQLLSLPMFPELTEAQVDYVCDQLARIL